MRFLSSIPSVEVSPALGAIAKQSVFFSDQVEVKEHPQALIRLCFMALDDVVIFTFRFWILVSTFSFGISRCFFIFLKMIISFFSGWVLDFT